MTIGQWRRGLVCGAMMISTAALAQWQPTRMQMCEAELAAQSGDARKKTMGECLRRRLEGEKIVERDCTRQLRDVAVDVAATSRADLQRQCVQRALQASYADLPRRTPSAPKPESALMATDGTNTPPPAQPVAAATAVNQPVQASAAPAQ